MTAFQLWSATTKMALSLSVCCNSLTTAVCGSGVLWFGLSCQAFSRRYCMTIANGVKMAAMSSWTILPHFLVKFLSVQKIFTILEDPKNKNKLTNKDNYMQDEEPKYEDKFKRKMNTNLKKTSKVKMKQNLKTTLRLKMIKKKIIIVQK